MVGVLVERSQGWRFVVRMVVRMFSLTRNLGVEGWEQNFVALCGDRAMSFVTLHYAA